MNIIVLSPHPDDETLGAGGTLLRLKEEGNNIFWLNVTKVSTELGYTKEYVEKREIQLEKISEFYGFSDVCRLNLETTRLKSYEDGEVIDQIGDYFKKVQPEWVLLPDFNDTHTDHQQVFQWAMACTKWFRFPSVKKICTMEILSETNFGTGMEVFSPTMFVDISNTFDRKLEAMRIYESELSEHPFPRSLDSIRALAILRGSAAGVKYAEGFRVIKEII